MYQMPTSKTFPELYMRIYISELYMRIRAIYRKTPTSVVLNLFNLPILKV